MRRLLIPAAATLVAGLGLAACTHSGEQTTPPAPTITVQEVTQTVRYLPDCEDEQTTPCVTLDEGTWREVTSYQPYKFDPLAVCDVEDYPTNVPCVWKKQHAQSGKWIVYTR